MKYRVSSSLALSIGVCLVILAFLLFSLSVKMYKSYRLERFLTQYAEENYKIAHENEQIKESYRYVKSPQYQDRFAKENLGKVNPGEKVIVLTTEEPGKKKVEARVETNEDTLLQLRALPPREQWMKYFFGERVL